MGSDASDDDSECDVCPAYLEEPPEAFHDIDCVYHFDNDHDCRREFEKDKDRIPSRLLSASSLFEQECNGVKRLTSYVDILERRAFRPLPGRSISVDEPDAWRNEKIKSSGKIVETAMMLLKYLHLPIETSMAYMTECKGVFRCRLCCRGPVIKGVTWPELVCAVVSYYCDFANKVFIKVGHFVYENDRFEDLRRRNWCVMLSWLSPL